MSNDKKTIRIACIDSEAPPLFNASPDGKAVVPAMAEPAPSVRINPVRRLF